jgi:two-component system, OmpR family, sensor kinase
MTNSLPPFHMSKGVPLLAAAAVFLFVTVTSQVALRLAAHGMDQEAERLGRVYLDGLSAAILPALRAQDDDALREALERAMGFREGISERRMIVATPAGRILAEAGIGPDPDWLAPLHRGNSGSAWEVAPDGQAVWVQRPLFDGALVALIAAKLDVGSITERRDRLRFATLAFGLAVAALGGGLAALAARQALRPVLVVTEALGRSGAGAISPVSPDAMPPPGTEGARLAAAFNGMVGHVAEREALARRLSERERAATLGRLAATVAHEVRNPLAGMLTAVDSAREFGDDAAERAEALQVIERGLRQIEGVVTSILAVHRDGGPPRPLEAGDFDDLRLLAAPEAARRSIDLEWHVQLPHPFATDASLLRQVALNLLLNAVAATPAGRRVALDVRAAGAALLTVAIEDEGPGLPPAAERRLHGHEEEAEGRGLGLDVVATLARRLGAAVAVEAGRGGQGTRVTLSVPEAGAVPA